ncbi:CoxG family protein [Streptacidiphilus sp. EB129]|uniref:CoxG family protein n=1 Tax=Streptacidiphilus sp. EB129 TaxID=3156262 RepID=UPI003517D29C
MEHDVLVPLPPHTVLQVLRDPELLARCLPGFTPDGTDRSPADRSRAGGLLAGRLKLRVGGSSITYRGELRPRDGEPLAFTVAAEQVVGSGGLTGTVRVTVLPEGDGSRIRVHGALSGKGRWEELDPEALAVAARRLLDRFCATLADEASAAGAPGHGGPADGTAGDDAAGAGAPSGERARADEPFAEDSFAEVVGEELFGEVPAPAEPVDGPVDERQAQPGPAGADADADADADDDSDPVDLGELGDLEGLEGLDDLDALDERNLFLIEEAAGAFDGAAVFDGAAALDESWPGTPGNRRSIVGRSAEEVDHAPPRGRYGPALPPRSARSRAAARWSSPERRMGEPPSAEGDRTRVPWVLGGGVAIIGGAVILVRALRRRA